ELVLGPAHRGGHDRRTDHLHREGGGRTARVERRGEAAVGRGPVEIVLDVVLAGPHHLHRRPRRLGGLHRFAHEVLHDPPPEPAAEEGGMHLHFRWIEPRDLRRHLLAPTAPLDGSSPAIFAPTSWTPPPRAGPHWYWVGTHMVHLSASTCAVAFIGSMQAWARYGASYTALTCFPPLASPPVPAFFATKPG